MTSLIVAYLAAWRAKWRRLTVWKAAGEGRLKVVTPVAGEVARMAEVSNVETRRQVGVAGGGGDGDPEEEEDEVAFEDPEEEDQEAKEAAARPRRRMLREAERTGGGGGGT
jgi:hypothetical protein